MRRSKRGSSGSRWSRTQSRTRCGCTWSIRDAQTSGVVWGNATLELYPARLWEPGESLLSRLPAATDATAIPDRYPLLLGMGPARPTPRRSRRPGAANAPTACRWAWWRSCRASASCHWRRSCRPTCPRRRASTCRTADSSSWPRVAPAGDAWPGRRMRFGLLVARPQRCARGAATARATPSAGWPGGAGDRPAVARRTCLAGQSAHGQRRPRRAGVRDRDRKSRATELRIEVRLGDGAARRGPLGSINVAGRARVFAGENEPAEAIFGERMQLAKHRLEPDAVRGGETVTVRLRWQSLDAHRAHLQDLCARARCAWRAGPCAARCRAARWSRADEPAGCPARCSMTSSRFSCQAISSPGEYPIEVGVYEERSGTRLLLPDGENHFVLSSRLQGSLTGDLVQALCKARREPLEEVVDLRAWPSRGPFLRAGSWPP